MEVQAALIAYHGDPVVKAKYVERFAAHRAADEVIQGLGFSEGRGCFVGCTLDNYDHSRFPIELGWPEWLARLADQIFAGLPKDEAPQFGSDLLEGVQVGANLDAVKARFLISIQLRNLARLKGNREPYAAECRKAIQGVIDWLSKGSPEASRESAWSAAWSAARSAARSAESAAWSARSAESAAWSAARSAESAAWSAARSAESAARSAESKAQRDSLLELVREQA